jgi:hypothetical protein
MISFSHQSKHIQCRDIQFLLLLFEVHIRRLELDSVFMQT